MLTTQTIELNDKERLTLQNALGIIDDIATIANTSVDNVFEYLFEVAEIAETKGKHEYFIKALHNIYEMK